MREISIANGASDETLVNFGNLCPKLQSGFLSFSTFNPEMNQNALPTLSSTFPFLKVLSVKVARLGSFTRSCSAFFAAVKYLNLYPSFPLNLSEGESSPSVPLPQITHLAITPLRLYNEADLSLLQLLSIFPSVEHLVVHSMDSIGHLYTHTIQSVRLSFLR